MIKILFFLALVLWVPCSAWGETVVLKSGKRIDGLIVEKAKDYIKMEADGSVLYYENKYIQEIQGSAPDPAAVTPGAPLEDVRAYLKQGLKLACEEKLEDAQRELSKGLALDATDSNIQGVLSIISDYRRGIVDTVYAQNLFRGLLFLMQEEYQKAIDPLERAWTVQPGDPDVNYNLGLAYAAIHDYKKAQFYLQIVVKLHPDDVSARALLAHVNKVSKVRELLPLEGGQEYNTGYYEKVS
jgi:tetratricopeptide (TPR) repeat protein